MKNDNLVLKGLSLLIFIYLILVPLGILKNKFDYIELLLIVVILLFNSGLIERLGKLEYKDGALSIEINELKKQQETQKDRIAANTDVIKRLTIAKTTVGDDKKAKKEFYENLVSQSELELLQQLANASASVTTQSLHSLKQELRRLRTLGFIETLPNQDISTIQDISSFREHVRLSERGKEFLKLIADEDSPQPKA